MNIDTPFKDARKLAYFNSEGADKPLKSPVGGEILNAARTFRLNRLRGEMERHDGAMGPHRAPLCWRRCRG